MKARTGWFEVDRSGLAALAARRNKRFILRELIQNAWDEASTLIEVSISKPDGSRTCTISVSDDSPEGFADLTHAYTLFAPSVKKMDATKRGRFNFGEKLVLALCKTASIETTKGTIYFEGGESRRAGRKKRASGSVFTGELTITRDEFEDLISDARRMIPPEGKRTIINGEELRTIKPVRVARSVVLMTEVAKDDGTLHSQYLCSDVNIYEPAEDEKGMLFELGIPVVETGDRYHADVLQKVPLNMERDNVSPAYLRDVRVAVANATADLLTVEDANSTWARDALADSYCTEKTAKTLVNLRFGEKAVVFDPSDLEANQKASAQGYTVVTSSQLNSDEWSRVREYSALIPAGRVCPTPRPFSDDGTPLELIAREDYTPEMLRFERFITEASPFIVGDVVRVEIANEHNWPFAAVFGQGRLLVNKAKVGSDWFSEIGSEKMIDLLIHEFGHSVCGNHLDDRYHEALTKMGGRFTHLALVKPELFR